MNISLTINVPEARILISKIYYLYLEVGIDYSHHKVAEDYVLIRLQKAGIPIEAISDSQFKVLQGVLYIGQDIDGNSVYKWTDDEGEATC